MQFTLQKSSLITLNTLANLKNLAAILPKRLIDEANTSTLCFISIIPSGGVETEFALHRFFHQYRVDKKGLGREWFSYTDELREFIVTLNTYIASNITGNIDYLVHL
ncbi:MULTISPECIES: hypothetical protein [unclassified Symbiopectobacterium]|uniref:hypothetical protein n=1 Tax=unclassified Symbiopectobacterium TaxID=2794573 RepID=UPI002226A2B3|nr:MULTISPECIES: hypothetical protein [unclassified Symbiopectobacterium]